jgi:nucleoside phosphorylase
MVEKEERLKVLLCHANENKPIVQDLFDQLKAAGFEPWLDSTVVKPGMNRERAIQEAMDTCDAIIICLSCISLKKESYFHKELRLAQDRQQLMPEHTIFLIPLRLDDCEPPYALRNIQWGDYRTSEGFDDIVNSLNVRARELRRLLGHLSPAKTQSRDDASNPSENSGSLTAIQTALGKLKTMIQRKGDFEFGDERNFTDRLDAQLTKMHTALKALNSKYDSKPSLSEINRYYHAIHISEQLQEFIREVRRKDQGTEENTRQLKVHLKELEEAISNLSESRGPSAETISVTPEDGGTPRASVQGTASQQPRSPTRRQPRVDVVILTVLEEEYLAICRQLQDLQTLPGTRNSPNQYAWQMGSVFSNLYQANYRVVVGMTGRAGNPHSAIVTLQAIELWAPRYIFFCGIAGGLMNFKKAAEDPKFKPDIRLGDVVIAERIHGYEFGKLEAVFQPRDDWNYRTNQGLWTKAVAYKTNAAWRKRIQRRPPRKRQPKILDGHIASGDKVVDDPTNAFFAAIYQRWPKVKAVEMEGAGVGAAIAEAGDRGVRIGFLMIRGISDIPRPPQSMELFKIWQESRGTQERDNWKPYAAEVAAAVTVGLIAEGLPSPPEDKN